MKRTPALTTKLGKTYECQRKLCGDPEIIRSWFELVKNTVNKCGILPGNIYNFDETGFQMGQISASKVVTAIDRPGRPRHVKPTNTERGYVDSRSMRRKRKRKGHSVRPRLVSW